MNQRKVIMVSFRILGFVIFVCSSIILYVLIRNLLPLFESFVQGQGDRYYAFLILTSLFLGVPFGIFIGLRYLYLRSFHVKKLFFFSVLIVSGLQLIIPTPLLFGMDKAMSFGIYYLIVIFSLYALFSMIHWRVYTPISHESMRHIGHVEPDRPNRFIPALYTVLLLSGLLVLHPLTIDESLKMLISPIITLFSYLIAVL